MSRPACDGGARDNLLLKKDARQWYRLLFLETPHEDIRVFPPSLPFLSRRLRKQRECLNLRLFFLHVLDSVRKRRIEAALPPPFLLSPSSDWGSAGRRTSSRCCARRSKGEKTHLLFFPSFFFPFFFPPSTGRWRKRKDGRRLLSFP